MRNRIVIGIMTAAAAIFMTASPASAVALTWVLQNAAFEDFGTATGSYDYDADTNTFSAINIVTTATGPGPFGTSYGLPGPYGHAMYIHFTESGQPYPAIGTQLLSFELLAPMTNAGGTIPILVTGAGGEAVCFTADCVTNFPVRLIRSGSVSAVPLPPALPLVTSGAGLLGLSAWSRKRRM